MTAATSRLEAAIRNAAAESRRLFVEEFNETPGETTIGDWDSAAWAEDLRNALIEVEIDDIEEDDHAALLETWRAVFFA